MNDCELNSLAVLVAAEQFSMEAANQQRASSGKAPAYGEYIEWDSYNKLVEELKRRKII